MKKKNEAPRKLHSGHFAFMRALVQGLDENASWNRYLHLEGEYTDLRTVRRTIASIRDQFAAAARRENKPGTARLILMDAERFKAAPALPSLAEFAAANGLEEFSEEEQLEAYQDAYPSGKRGAGQGGGEGEGQGANKRSQRPSRRARVVERQLEALRWLQGLVAQDPKPSDSVSAWLNPSMAKRLERAGLTTLSVLVERINGVGARWWALVPGVGEGKAARMVEWLQANEALLGLKVGRHVAQPRMKLASATLEAVVPAATAIRPYEKFVLPAELDGRAGRFRARPENCLLAAGNDHEAIGAWLSSKAAGAKGNPSATQRAYRKEAERLLLWAVLERKKALSSLTLEDATAYRDFLADPPAAWCGPRHHQRWSPLWRPLEGPLHGVTLRHSLTVVRSLFAFLMRQGYLMGNPFVAVALPVQPLRPLGSSRTLTFAQWDHIDALLEKYGETEADRRLRRGMRWLYATGLRLAEITSVKCEDLTPVEYRADGTMATDWLLAVIGKGNRSREVPVPAKLVEELGDELARHGFDRQVGAVSNRGVHVMSRFDDELKRPAPWSASGLYQGIKAFLAQAAGGLDAADASQLKKASTHWLRHSHGSHALQGREGRAPVPLQIVQNNLGHASVGTTSLYLTTERDERLKAMRGFWKVPPLPE
ncbi:phage integrase family protein [Variovorax sp. dw_954]|uniref:phage integrase family protein n=1 Tax=Variovorax sp. dw_954 TaxID=2720078 RepID=UPI001BD2830B|nr:phage integrase family protein [Variovorax sp. dw_954]